MSTGVANTLACIQSVQDLTVRVITDLKTKSVFSFFKDIPELMGDVKTLTADIPKVIPEFSSLDSGEVMQLGEAAYQLVSAVVQAVSA